MARIVGWRPASLALIFTLGCTLLRPLDDLEPGDQGSGRAGAGVGAEAGAGGASGVGGAGGGVVGGGGGGGANGTCQANIECGDAICDEETGACSPCSEDMALARFSSDGALGPSFCVDKFEVTQGRYNEFLLGVNAGDITPSSPYEACKNHVHYDPGATPGGDECRTAYRPEVTPDLPVTCVDFCDAAAYCASKGRGLCGDRKTASLDRDQLSQSKFDQWFVACAGVDPEHKYPYGDTFDAGACNVNQPGAGPVVGDDFAGCVTASGVHHLSGNVAEWGASCLENAYCVIRGGSFLTVDGEADAGCRHRQENAPGVDQGALRLARRAHIGFRCCAD
jgi:formylglycine-generating enzyme